ncbi:MAG: hypothetical protein ACK52I_24660 [Pseudomonadota bacterium]
MRVAFADAVEREALQTAQSRIRRPRAERRLRDVVGEHGLALRQQSFSGLGRRYHVPVFPAHVRSQAVRNARP